jgi:hypothetical protein
MDSGPNRSSPWHDSFDHPKFSGLSKTRAKASHGAAMDNNAAIGFFVSNNPPQNVLALFPGWKPGLKLREAAYELVPRLSVCRRP